MSDKFSYMIGRPNARRPTGIEPFPEMLNLQWGDEKHALKLLDYANANMGEYDSKVPYKIYYIHIEDFNHG